MAEPTPVNPRVTDWVTQSTIGIPADSPGEALAERAPHRGRPAALGGDVSPPHAGPKRQ